MWQTLNFIVVTKMTYDISTHWKISTNHYCWEYYSHPTVYCIITYCVMHRRPLEINTHKKHSFFYDFMMSYLHFKIWTIHSVGDKLSFHSPGFLSQWNVVFSAHPLSPVKCKERRVAEVCVCVRVLYFHTLAGIKLCVTTWGVLWFFYHITSHDITLINTNPRSWNHWVSVHDFWQRKKKRNCSKLFFSCFF